MLPHCNFLLGKCLTVCFKHSADDTSLQVGHDSDEEYLEGDDSKGLHSQAMTCLYKFDDSDDGQEGYV